MINFKNIYLAVNSQILFDNLNLSVLKGEKTAIKGRSGKGKTTLFNMLMGFVKPDKGEIYFDNLILNRNNISKIRKRIAWLPQNPSIIGRGKIIEQLILPFHFKINKTLLPDHKSIEMELEKLNLDKSILKSSFEEISGGEKQRLGIIVCKLLKRDVLLLDEPTSALDKSNLNSVAEYLLKDKSITVLSASHDEEWLRHCDKIIDI
ncbi:ATP-binding cassette domain-containing protein [Bacteroidetes/Chlorobi group bacterium ChocPot_Mid]|jgi:putative ABC transport system ATP-binding protein|nr:MAG: ATP-binding cassette domain-containing protein [Bacteroidetes/Chlorobi group bacterium ChocPot_Mid]